MINAHDITKEFEKELSKYTGAPYVICVDNQSNALFLSLYYELNVVGAFKKPMYVIDGLSIPAHTYPSVPCEILHVGQKVNFYKRPESPNLKGEYQIEPTIVWDSALRFTANMYVPGRIQCISFTGPHKHLKLGKGGAILTDGYQLYKWAKKARFSGRDECSYHEDDFDINPVVGWNMYMPVETAARGLHMMPQFYDKNGKPKHNEDLELPYPDLSKFKIFQS